MTQQLQFVMLAGAVALLGLIFFFLKIMITTASTAPQMTR